MVLRNRPCNFRMLCLVKPTAVPIVQHFVWPAPFDHNDVLASHHYGAGVGLVRNYVKTSARGAKKRAEAEAAREGVWRVHGKALQARD